MKNHDKHQDVKRDRKKESGYGGSKEHSKSENHKHFDADEDTTPRISFQIDFSLAEGQIKGKITHRLTHKQMEFDGLDQAAISQFMKKYLSGLDKGVARTTETVHLPSGRDQDATKQTQAPTSTEIRTKTFHVIPAGSSQPSAILQPGQPFQLQWCFDPPASLSVRGQQMSYKISVCRKQLDSGQRELVGITEGEAASIEALTASIHSGPLPSGTYRLEADARFSLRDKKPDWTGDCRSSCVIHVA